MLQSKEAMVTARRRKGMFIAHLLCVRPSALPHVGHILTVKKRFECTTYLEINHLKSQSDRK